MSVVNTPEQKVIEGVMRDLMRQIELLAPHPDHRDYKGPLFVSIDPSMRPAAEYDGMLGSMVLDGMLGMAFSHAASGWAGPAANNNWNNAAEAGSYYLEDRAGHGGFHLGQRHALSGRFNDRVHREALMQAYLHDLPRRMGLERWLAAYQRKLYSLRKQAVSRGFALAAC